MKILLVTDYFYPLSNGGTEKYVYLLAKHLESNYEVKVLSVHDKLKENFYLGLGIDYILPNTNDQSDVIRGIEAPDNLSIFEQYLKKYKPNIVHFHTLTSNFNHHHIQLSFKLGIKTFFTSHIPGHQCLRGDFMYNGKIPCDGKIEKSKCTQCLVFSGKESIPKKLSKYFYYNLSGKNPAALKLKQLKSIESGTNKIIAVCQWQKDFLEKNGIARNHLELVRQSVSSKEISKRKNEKNKIRLGFIGRIEPIKGLHLLLNTLSNNKHLAFDLAIAAIPPSNEHQTYFNNLQISSKDLDCKWNFNLNTSQVEDFFAEIDYLVIPSLCYETGPFVGHEALAYHTPILATKMGGQKELVLEGQNGYLFDPNEESLTYLLTKLNLLPILKQDFTIIYNEEKIATEMQQIYMK